MSDNHVGEGFLAGEDGDSRGVSPAGSANGTAESADNSVNQVDHADRTNGITLDSVQQDPNDTRVAEDGGREDMFVDCPDDIETSETQQTSDEKDDTQDTQFKESDNGIKIQNLMTEMEQLRDMHEKSVTEKDRIVQGYEEERAAVLRELAHLCHQIKGLNDQQSLPSEHGEGLLSGASLLDMISECSKCLGNALEARLETEGKIRELHSILNTKDQEFDLLNAKVAELSESSNVLQSDLTSKHELLSKSYEAQLEKDRLIEEITNRIIASLSVTVHEQESLDVSLEGKISQVEKNITHLIEKNNIFISEIDHLRVCLTEVVPDLNVPDEIGVFVNARDKLLELKEKGENFYQNLSHLEDENRKLVEQLDEHKVMVENANGEIGRLSAEVEQEKTKYSNTKEKLSLAVTKGKALVQQRDSLKQSLAEKTSEMQKCLIELQEKSSALEAAERSKEVLATSENLAASLQESLMHKDTILQKCGEILAESAAMEELQSTDIVEKLSWLADERKSLQAISLEYYKLIDALSSFDFPEPMLSSAFDARVSWLVESFSLSREEAVKLKHEIEEAKEAANNEIDRLTPLLLAETQEKSYLQAELEDLRNKYETNEKLQHEVVEAKEAANSEIDHLTSLFLAEIQEKTYIQAEWEDLRHKYEGIVQKEYQISLEKDRLVNMLLEASGIVKTYQEEVSMEQPDMIIIIDKCLAKMKEDASHPEYSHVEVEMFESFQSLLYIRDQELRLYELILADDVLDKMEVNRLSNELGMVTQEVSALNDEKAVLQKKFEQLEEKNALVREKLSMAVKKGKGLVQERENLKGALNEKNAEIDKLKTELQQQVSKFNECQDQISKLLLEVERIPQLEADLVSMKEHGNQLEQFLVGSNSMLQRVMESIDGIKPSVDLVFEEPVDKTKWIAGYVGECETAKMEVERELRKVKDEASSLGSLLTEAQTMTKSLKDALSVAENKMSLLLEEKKELEVVKTRVEDELQRAMEEASSQTSRFEEFHLSRRSLEDALSLAENNISKLMNERDVALESRALAEEQLHKLKEEFSINTSKLSEADNTIQALEDALSQAQKNVLLLTEENNEAQTGRIDLDNEMKKLKEEADLQASKLADASLTIKSLENALLNAENNLADLVNAKKNAEQETLALNSKLNACMQELAGKHGTLNNRSLELSGHLSRLQMLVKDESLLLTLQEFFEKKFESLKDMDILLKEIKDYFHEMDSDVLQNGPVMEDDLPISSTFPSSLDNVLNVEMVDGEVYAADDESMSLRIGKLVEGFYLKDKILADKFDDFSKCMDESNAAMLRKLDITKDRMISMLELIKYLKQKVKDIETDKRRQENTIVSLGSDIRILFSACADATRELELDVQNNMLESRSVHKLVNYPGTVGGDEAAALVSENYAKTAEKLLFAARHSRDLSKQFQDAINKLVNSIEDMQNKLEKTELTHDEVLKERDICKDRIFKLETDLEARQNLCNEMSLKLENYQTKEAIVKEREADFSSDATTLSQFREPEVSLLSSSQMKSLLDKINEIEVPDSAFAVKEVELHDSIDRRKLFYVLDSFNKLQQKVSSLSHEKEEVQSILEEQVLEIEHLKTEVEYHMRNEYGLENIKNELVEIETGLKNNVRKLGGNEFIDDYKVGGAVWLLPVLDKLVMATILESENLKSETDELKAKLLGTQKVVDDLSSKVKLLEDSNQSINSPPETGQERGISTASLPTPSEISEIQDMGTLGKGNNLPPVPSAAHVRPLRKGSSDQLAIDIDSDSERLVNNKEADEDKGHLFKSLNTSGLVPRQGRIVADRIDGIWVSGSRALMSRPRARLGLVAYWLVLHIWLLGAIL
ncbi:hypothetical protein Fot_16390 [Forsythia ovata]|uniref:Uncharacterized protein n=1 Tax=Forsythia ovata TaxID=205694 RepID=A0ABD1WC64_9LAMI